MNPDADSAAPFLEATPAELGNSGAPEMRLGAYEGPLDLLLALARAQKVDLAQLSIGALAEQFTTILDAAMAGRQVPLARLAEWLIMAAWLVALRARLLLPPEAAESAEARRDAAALRQRLADRDAALRLADWLERRPQLGRAVFGRGADDEPTPDARPAADVTELLRACLKLLEMPQHERIYRPSPPPLWRVPAALTHVRRLLAELPGRVPLARFLPPPAQGPAAPVQRRAALASTLMATLELSREGALQLDQSETFGEIHITAARTGHPGHNQPAQ